MGALTFRRNRTSVEDEYGAGPPEVRGSCHAPFFRYGRKRGFSPSLNRGLGEGKREVRRLGKNLTSILFVCLFVCYRTGARST